MTRLRRFGILAVLSFAGVVGCGGPPTIAVEGQITVKGTPIKVAPMEQLSVSYVGEQNKQQMYSAMAGPDGKYKVADHLGKGIPPGAYKIVVQLTTNGPGGSGDRFRDAYSLAKTPLRHDVRADNTTISLDVTAPAAK